MYLGQGTSDTIFTRIAFNSVFEAIEWLKSPNGWLGLTYYKITHKNIHIEVKKCIGFREDNNVYHFSAYNKKTKHKDFYFDLTIYELETT